MNWYPIEALEPGKLVVLHFRDETAQQCVGYVEQDGVCGWPEKGDGPQTRRLARPLFDVCGHDDRNPPGRGGYVIGEHSGANGHVGTYFRR
ncbi:hypothetical protein LZK73_08510 [Neorhizobium galegae]|nr:hypothetical protein LZK73_08510 [Neorhizobium galegae]